MNNKKHFLHITLILVGYILFVALVITGLVIKNQLQSPVVMVGAIRSGPPDIYPNPARTPGVTNPAITQANIAETLCNRSWSTKTIRPASTYTSKLKVQQIKEYGYTATTPGLYEEDHLISLELGGNPTDPKNLWPEPYAASIVNGGAKSKDFVENLLHRELCAGTITLKQAQDQVVSDWYALTLKLQNTPGALLTASESDDE